MTIHYQSPISCGLSKDHIEEFAENLANLLEFNPGDSLGELVKKTGGNIVVGTSGNGDASSGSIIASSLNNYTIFISENTSRHRDRFTIAHELGHLLLHFPKIKQQFPDAVMRATRWIDENDPSQQRAEREANWFAAAFLMPKKAFISAWRNGQQESAQLLFDLSLSAINTRARSLNLT